MLTMLQYRLSLARQPERQHGAVQDVCCLWPIARLLPLPRVPAQASSGMHAAGHNLESCLDICLLRQRSNERGFGRIKLERTYKGSGHATDVCRPAAAIFLRKKARRGPIL
ncbi:MAG TPA: hypothetical protein VGF67_31070 [Ktedonobacteraceae bacterium]